MSACPEVGGVAKTEASVPNLLNLSTEYCGSVDEGALKQILFLTVSAVYGGTEKNLVVMSDIRI
jgi:hypothetical protein